MANNKETEWAELHKTPWRIANDLRGSVDGWDFKTYLLGMLFDRFISEPSLGRDEYSTTAPLFFATVPLVQLLVTPDREKRIPLYKQIDTANAAAEGDLAALAFLVKAPQEKARVQELLELRARYDERYTAAVEELELSGAQGALSQFWAPTREALATMTQASRRLAEQERSTLATQRVTLESFGAETQRLMWVAAAVALLAAALGGLGVRMLGRGVAA